MDDILHQKSRLKEQLQHSSQDNKSKVNPAPIAGEFTGTVESAAHTEQLLRFNAHQGHGFAAEQANDLLDTLHGSDANILGNDNAKNGADRMVDGLLIQTKYCQTAQASVDAAFNQQTKLYRYIDKNGVPMQLEVPSDQYDAAIQIMRKKIAAGQVPGVTDPNDAVNLVRKGNVTYQTACNIAKAGTVDSLAFDAAHGSVVAVSTFGISALITFAHSLWSGKNVEDAIDASMYVGLKMGGSAFLSTVIASQITRTGLSAAIQQPLIGVIKALPSGVRKSMVSVMKDGAFLYGRGTAGNLAKLWSSNIITSVAFTLVLSASDIMHFFSGKISGKQLFKNITNLATGMGGAYGGAALGSVFGPIGTVAGGIAGGVVASAASSSILNHFIEDDAVAMVKILNDCFVVLAQEYLLNEEEVNLVLEDLQVQLVHEKLLEMFASKNRKAYADELLRNIIEKIIRMRAHIFLPPDDEFLAGINRILALGKNPEALKEHLIGKKVDAVAVGKKLLNRDISKHAADKAWYATKQMNLVNMQQEMCLTKMKSDEQNHRAKIKEQREEMNQIVNAIKEMLEE